MGGTSCKAPRTSELEEHGAGPPTKENGKVLERAPNHGRNVVQGLPPRNGHRAGPLTSGRTSCRAPNHGRNIVQGPPPREGHHARPHTTGGALCKATLAQEMDTKLEDELEDEAPEVPTKPEEHCAGPPATGGAPSREPQHRKSIVQGRHEGPPDTKGISTGPPTTGEAACRAPRHGRSTIHGPLTL